MTRTSRSMMLQRMTPLENRALLMDAVMASLSLQPPTHKLPNRIPAEAVYNAFRELRGTFPQWLGSLHFEGEAGR